MKYPIRSLQVSLFSQGLEAHSNISTLHIIPVYPVIQVQLNPLTIYEEVPLFIQGWGKPSSMSTEQFLQ